MPSWIPLKDRMQNELLKRGHCVACTRSLKDAEREPYSGNENRELAICKCRRVYVYDKQVNSYRRAELDEVNALE